MRWTFSDPSPFTSTDVFGSVLAVSGNYLVVGARGRNDSGTAFVYDLTTGLPVRTLLNPEPHLLHGFGQSVAISGTKGTMGSSTG